MTADRGNNICLSFEKIRFNYIWLEYIDSNPFMVRSEDKRTAAESRGDETDRWKRDCGGEEEEGYTLVTVQKEPFVTK